MTHHSIELALWLATFFFIGCPLGAVARRLLDGRRQKTSAS